MRIDAGMVVLMRLMIGSASVAARAHRTKPRSFHGTVSLQSPCASSRALPHHSPSLDPFRHKTALSSSFPNPRSAPTPPPRAMPDRPSPGGGPGTGPPGGGRGTDPPGGGRGTDPPGGGRGTDGGRGTGGGRGSDGGRWTDGALGKDTGEEDHIPKDPKFWGNLLVFFQGLSSPVVDKLKAVLATSNSNESAVPLDLPRLTEKLSSAGAMENLSDDLPRLSLYCDTVFGAAMTRAEEIALKKYLQHVLEQLQYSLKEMGLQPVELHDAEIVQPFPRWRAAHPLFVGHSARWKHSPGSDLRSRIHKLEDELEETSMQNKELVAIFDKLTSDMKLSISGALYNHHLTSEYAKELELIVDCCNKNVRKALQQSGHKSLTLKGLQRRIDIMSDEFATWKGNWKMYGSGVLFAATVAGSTFESVGTSPPQFKFIGKEAQGVLNVELKFDKMKLRSDPHYNMSFGVGAKFGGGQRIADLMLKCNSLHESISVNLRSVENLLANGDALPANGDGANAPANQPNDIAATKIKVDKLLGSNFKSVLRVPFPSLNGNFEVICGMPHVVCAGGVELVPTDGGRVPVFSSSAVLGWKHVGLGSQISFREGQRTSTFGMSLRTELFAAGLTYENPGTYKASIWKKILDSTITVAAEAGYSPLLEEGHLPVVPAENQGFRFGLGLRHAIDPTCYWKTRIGTDGASFLMKKSNTSGMFSVKGAMQVDFQDPWRFPKIGVLCSFRR